MAQPLPLDRGAVYRAVNAETGQIIVQRVRVAKTVKSRIKGLLGRRGLDPDEGLLITPCDSVHTFFMKFPIDLLYLNQDLKVVRIIANMRPSRMTSCLGKASHVLELKGGVLEAFSNIAGATIRFEKQA